MGTETLETKCQKSIIQIANDVKEINEKLFRIEKELIHIIETRHDYFFRKPNYYAHDY